jgi:hypothetical protein
MDPYDASFADPLYKAEIYELPDGSVKSIAIFHKTDYIGGTLDGIRK